MASLHDPDEKTTQRPPPRRPGLSPAVWVAWFVVALLYGTIAYVVYSFWGMP